MVIDSKYLCETPCYESSFMLDERSVFELPPNNPFRCDNIMVFRAWRFFENIVSLASR